MKTAVLRLGDFATQHFIKSISALDVKLNYRVVGCDFNLINSLLPGPSRELDKVFDDLVIGLKKEGYEEVLIPNVTILNYFIDRKLSEQIKVFSPYELLQDKMEKLGQSKLTFLSSKYLAKEQPFNKYLSEERVSVLPLSKSDVNYLDSIRLSIFENGAVDIKQFNNIIASYPKTVMVLSCSEFSIVNSELVGNTIDLLSLQLEEWIAN
tara:strand:+ start:3423 stop:4049 length:627 start_codon:yes stop_codon:yes gene_type:complete